MMSPMSEGGLEGINAGVGTDDLEPILDRSLT